MILDLLIAYSFMLSVKCIALEDSCQFFPSVSLSLCSLLYRPPVTSLKPTHPHCLVLPSLVCICVMTRDVRSSKKKQNKTVTLFNCLSKNMLCVGLLLVCVCVCISVFVCVSLNSFHPCFCWGQVHSFTQRYVMMSPSLCMRGLVRKFYDCLRVRGHDSNPENHFSALFFTQTSSVPPYTHSHVLGSSAGWSLPLENLFTVTHHGFISLWHASSSASDHMPHSSIVRFRQTVGHLDIFLLYVLWISLHDTMEMPSLCHQSLVYTQRSVCKDSEWKHERTCRIRIKKEIKLRWFSYVKPELSFVWFVWFHSLDVGHIVFTALHILIWIWSIFLTLLWSLFFYPLHALEEHNCITTSTYKYCT